MNSLSDLRLSGKIIMIPRYLDCDAPRTRRTLSDFKKSGGRKGKNGYAISKKHGCPISHWTGRSIENHDIQMANPPETRKALSNLKKKEKMGCPISKNQGCPMSDGENIDIKRRYSDDREFGDRC